MVIVANIKEEYYLLTDHLDEFNQALDGDCDDVDCDKYLFREYLKKRFKPLLEHGFSCIEGLKRQKAVLMRLVSLPKYKRFRFKKCPVCKNEMDKLGEDYMITCFTEPTEKKKKYYKMEIRSSHTKCKSKLNAPKGFTELF